MSAYDRTLWRVSEFSGLHGTGGRLVAGRWHTPGRPVVYLADSPAGALLERLAQFDNGQGMLPRSYQLMEIRASDMLPLAVLEPPAGVPWQESPEKYTRPLGDQWLADGKTALARVPSALVPRTFHYLYNPRHRRSGDVRVVSSFRVEFDLARLRSRED